jgi:hypothetical protein
MNENMKLNFNWKVLLASIAIMGVLATSLGYIAGVSSATMTTGIKIWSKTKTAVASTYSTSYVLVPGMKLTIDAPVGTNLVITFSTACDASPNTSFYIRLIVDGLIVDPKSTLLNYGDSGDGSLGAYSFTWVTHVTKGTHTIKVKWRSGLGGRLQVTGRSLVVLGNSYKEFT